MRAIRPKRSSRMRASGAAHPSGGRRLASAMMPPAHIAADRTWIASASSAPAACGCTPAAWLDRGSITAASTAGTATNRLPRRHRIQAAPSAARRRRTSHVRASVSRMRAPMDAARKKSCIGGRAQRIRGVIRPRRLTPKEPMPASRPKYSSPWPAKGTTSGGGDDASAQDSRARVEHGRLSRSRAEEWLLERKASARVDGGDCRRVVAEPGLAGQRFGGHAVDEPHLLHRHLTHRKLIAPADDDGVRPRLDSQHVPGPGLGKASEPRALADRVEGGAAVRPELAAVGGDDLSGAHRQPGGEVARRLASRHEADLLALRLVGHGQAEFARVLADLALRHSAKRKVDAREAIAVEVIEHLRMGLP